MCKVDGCFNRVARGFLLVDPSSQIYKDWLCILVSIGNRVCCEGGFWSNKHNGMLKQGRERGS